MSLLVLLVLGWLLYRWLRSFRLVIAILSVLSLLVAITQCSTSSDEDSTPNKTAHEEKSSTTPPTAKSTAKQPAGEDIVLDQCEGTGPLRFEQALITHSGRQAEFSFDGDLSNLEVSAGVLLIGDEIIQRSAILRNGEVVSNRVHNLSNGEDVDATGLTIAPNRLIMRIPERVAAKLTNKLVAYLNVYPDVFECMTLDAKQQGIDVPEGYKNIPEETAPSAQEEPAAAPEEPVPAPEPPAPVIDHCGDPNIHENGTTFFTDGTTGWTEECSRQMPAVAPAPQAFMGQVPPANEEPPAQDVYYKNCDAARAAGAAPILAGQPGYRAALDRDNDGIACEPKR